MTPREFIGKFIEAHEGGLSMHPADNGNWYSAARYKQRLPQVRGQGALVGSKFGVTAYALADYRGTTTIDADDIAGLSFSEAVDVGMKLYYTQPGFGRLAWNRVTASILDKAWGSGPGQAIKLMQRMIGVGDDGKLGAVTAAAYAEFIRQHGEEEAAARWADVRIAFDQRLASNEGPNDPDRKFINGWNNRTRSFLPGTPWWRNW
jgi:lysozyme family protein